MIPALVVAAEVVTNFVYYKYKPVVINTVHEVEGRDTHPFNQLLNFLSCFKFLKTKLLTAHSKKSSISSFDSLWEAHTRDKKNRHYNGTGKLFFFLSIPRWQRNRSFSKRESYQSRKLEMRKASLNSLNATVINQSLSNPPNFRNASASHADNLQGIGAP